MKRILCYGDSNTWGFVPGKGTRFSKEERWTGIVQRELGDEYEIIEDGINGRTTIWDHPFLGEYVNGYKGLPYSLFRSKPIDLVFLMLGSNDHLYTNSAGIYRGIYKVAKAIKYADIVFEGSTDGSRGIFIDKPNVILASPIVSAECTKDNADGTNRYIESRRAVEEIRKVSEVLGLEFFDASLYSEASEIDGIHMDSANHKKLGLAIADYIRLYFDNNNQKQ